jgi:DNA-binding HxlR family transcriptional regulator
MKERKSDVLQPYVLPILRALDGEPKRFLDLKKVVTNETTLSAKLSQLLNSGMIEAVPVKAGKRYVSAYKLTLSGRGVLKALEKF